MTMMMQKIFSKNVCIFLIEPIVFSALTVCNRFRLESGSLWYIMMIIMWLTIVLYLYCFIYCFISLAVSN